MMCYIRYGEGSLDIIKLFITTYSNNTVHGSLFIEKLDMPFVSSGSIQKDVVALLNSPENKFPSAIEIGSLLCYIPKAEVAT
jgi:hypothetical protein